MRKCEDRRCGKIIEKKITAVINKRKRKETKIKIKLLYFYGKIYVNILNT